MEEKITHNQPTLIFSKLKGTLTTGFSHTLIALVTISFTYWLIPGNSSDQLGHLIAFLGFFVVALTITIPFYLTRLLIIPKYPWLCFIINLLMAPFFLLPCKTYQGIRILFYGCRISPDTYIIIFFGTLIVTTIFYFKDTGKLSKFLKINKVKSQ